MAKIKHTKNELKAQKAALSRFKRFLPMLQLKKQQLQVEIQGIDAKLAQSKEQEGQLRASLEAWVKLFSVPELPEDLVRVEAVNTSEGNIAGVSIPLLEQVDMARLPVDLYATPAWFDDAAEVLEQMARFQVEQEIFEEQKRRISEELRTTSQRVNLFEKVKIPECKEHIRVIKIFLGDQQTAGVVRGKFAKRRSTASAEEDSRVP